jgi:hypothetical protein
MNGNRKHTSIIILLASISVVFFTCKNPLTRVGLGDKVDLDVPDLSIDSHENGDFVSFVDGDFEIYGRYADDIEVASVTISFDGGNSFANTKLDSKKRKWSFLVRQADGYTDGEKELIIQATDTSDKVIEKRLFLFFDTAPPLVLVTVPYEYKYDPPLQKNTFNGEFSLKGEAADSFGIKRVTVDVYDSPMGASPLQSYTAAGTASWTALIDSTALTAGSAEFVFLVIAEDNAGNSNAHVYNYKDVYEANDTNTITVEQLYQIEQGTDVGQDITPATLPDYRKYHDPGTDPKFTLRIDQDEDRPKFVVSNPDEGSPPDQNILGSSANGIGLVEDDDGVSVSSIGISIDGGGWTSPTQTVPASGSALSVRWQYDLSGLSEGLHTIQVQAQDIYGTSGSSAAVGFTVDLGAPSVEITSPAQGSYHNGTILVQGTASDPQGVTSVKVSTDGGVDYYDATDTGGGFSTWQYNAAVPGDGLTDGSRTIKVMAEDSSAKVGYTNLQVIIDTQDPLVSFLTPANSSTVNGEVLLRGTASDNTQVSKVELKVGKSDPWIEMSGTYNWEYTIDSVSYANLTHADETPPGSDVWRLNIRARATDAAGNVTELANYNLFIDNNLDKPTVNVISPLDGQNLGGSVLVSGTAFDDDAVHHVEMRLDLNHDGDFLDKIDLNGDFDTLDAFEDEQLWVTVSGATTWTQNLNTAGELYQTEPGHDGQVTIRVRAVDTKDGFNPDLAGNYQELTVHFDDAIPRLENVSHSSGDYVKGIFNLTADVLDDIQVDGIYISYDGGVSYDDVLNDPTYSGTFVQNDVNDYSIDIPINTIAISSGILYLRLKVVDNANYQKLEYINLNVDNVYPEGIYTGDSLDIYGSDVHSRVQGTATDAESVSGIEQIQVYFVRGGSVYNPQTGGTIGVGSTDFGDGNGSVAYTVNPSYKIIIDNRYELGNDSGGNGDGDGYDESLTLAGSTYNWWAEFDSTNIPDGTVDIHYVVFDNAGNGHHYLQPGFIKNHKPAIDGLVVGSDVDMSGSVEADEQFSYDEEFSARNYLYIQINASDDDPPGLSYAVYHDPGGANTLVSTNVSEEIDISGYSEEGTDFLCRVTDSDGIVVEATIEVTIENQDTVDPSISISALAETDAVDGHIEQDGDSLHDGTDADVSGTITLTGSSSDNQRIQSITVTIDDFDAGSGTGIERTVASWSGTADELVSSDPAHFVIGSQSLDEADGHQVSWSYTWNTAAITGSARNNIDILFKASDFGPNTATDTMTVDVVPYISGIVRTFNTQRSKYGKFQVQEGETGITINGYNLAETGTNWARVYNSAGSAYDDVIVTASGSPYTSFTISLAGVTHSGWLRLAVNGVEAINNSNDNTLEANKEDDGSGLANTRWTDDRYLRVWAVGNMFNQSGDPQHPSMSVDSNGTLYGSWTNSATSRAYYATTAARTTFFEKYDPPEYTDIYIDSNNNLNIAYLANYFNGANSWGFLSLWNEDAPNQNSYDNYDAYLFEWLGADDMLFQFQRPRVVRSEDNLHLAYYDLNEKTLKYAYVENADQTTRNHSDWNGSGVHAHLNLDGGEAQPAGNGQSGPLTALAGEYMAIDIDENGCPVIMYYDISHQTLKLAYSGSAIPTAYGNWTIQTVFKADDPNRSFVGKYITMKIDSGGNIHAACSRTSTGSLIYLYAPDADGADYSFDYSVEVDTEGAVGTWADITLNGTTPYISYLNNSMIGTFDGLKMAYYDGSLGEWEHEIVPIITGITENRTNVEYRKGAVNWLIAIGYASSNFDIVYLKPEE